MIFTELILFCRKMPRNISFVHQKGRVRWKRLAAIAIVRINWSLIPLLFNNFKFQHIVGLTCSLASKTFYYWHISHSLHTYVLLPQKRMIMVTSTKNQMEVVISTWWNKKSSQGRLSIFLSFALGSLNVMQINEWKNFLQILFQGTYVDKNKFYE